MSGLTADSLVFSTSAGSLPIDHTFNHESGFFQNLLGDLLKNDFTQNAQNDEHSNIIALDQPLNLNAPEISTFQIEVLEPAEKIDVLQGQKYLAALGFDLEQNKEFDNNGVDGIEGAVTQDAVTKFQTGIGLEVTGRLNPETLAALEQQVIARGVEYVPGMETKNRPSLEVGKKTLSDTYHTVANHADNAVTLEVKSSYVLNKDAHYLMETGSAETLSYIDMAEQAALENGLDPVLFINQLASESAFDPNADSRLAKGIGQFTPETGAQYGLSGNDFFDPQKSIDASANYMKDLTNQYGSQELALVPYNGSDRAIKSAARQLGQETIDHSDFMKAMEVRRIENPNAGENAWHKETYDYLNKILTTADSSQDVAVVSVNAPTPQTLG